MIVRCFVFALSFLVLLESCSKSRPATPGTLPGGGTQPVDSTKKTDTTGSVYVAGNWQCQVDGVSYNGMIDTSFTYYDSTQSASQRLHPDTVLFCTGSSTDKRANIHFQLQFNRYPLRNVPYFTGIFDFDTCSNNIVQASQSNSPDFQFYIDSVSASRIKVHFSGTAQLANAGYGTSSHLVTNGVFTAGFRGGNHDPNYFRYQSNLSKVDGFDPTLTAGYFNEARLISNSLVLDGTPTAWSLQDKFRLIIRTGGTIKPGTYYSANGDAGLQLYVPSLYRHYINDSLGSLAVTITKVSGNVVYGNFSGTNPANGIESAGPISAGSFAVRVKNYVPQADSVNKWAFGQDDGSNTGIFHYRTFGGNVLSAALTQNTGRYYLTINGESDHGASVFKTVVSSGSPITTGLYSVAYGAGTVSSGRMDSLYFMSPEKIWNGNNTYLYSDGYTAAYVQIDSIDAHYVKGKLLGAINIYLSGAGYTRAYIREGRFSASF